MFKFTKQVIFAQLRFGESLAKKCAYLNTQPFMTRFAFIDLNPGKLCYYPVIVSLDSCDGSCNTLTNLSDRICLEYIFFETK